MGLSLHLMLHQRQQYAHQCDMPSWICRLGMCCGGHRIHGTVSVTVWRHRFLGHSNGDPGSPFSLYPSHSPCP